MLRYILAVFIVGLYNVLFTALPPFAMGLFDKTCSAETMMAYPQLYKPSQSGELFNVKVFWVWVVNGMIHSAILYWLPLLICQNDILWMNGKEGGYLVLGNCVYTVSIDVCSEMKIVFTKEMFFCSTLLLPYASKRACPRILGHGSRIVLSGVRYLYGSYLLLCIGKSVCITTIELIFICAAM